MGYVLDDDPARLDVDVIWTFLSQHAYWARWRTRADVERQIAGSWRVVGCYVEETGQQVGFARAVSDGVALGYLADVFVVESHRGHGLGVRIVAELVEQGAGADFRWLLHTADAHDLYRRFGFGAPDETFMERHATRR